jgi:peptidyl-tRNA hydrolase, PTH1 family
VVDRCIVGLGNPGRKYANTRHNIGFHVVEALARRHGFVFKEMKRFCAYVARGTVRGITVHLIMPQTFMNESGRTVQAYTSYFSLACEDLLVVSDDATLEFGRMRLREQGSSGGHNGLKDIERNIGTSQYARLKMGIGHDSRKQLHDYVLQPFTSEENILLPEFVGRGATIVDRWFDEDRPRVINDANTFIKSAYDSEKNNTIGVNPNVKKDV